MCYNISFNYFAKIRLNFELIDKDDYVIKVEEESIVDKVFKELQKAKKVEKFVVEAPSLNEIFISKVGESYEE